MFSRRTFLSLVAGSMAAPGLATNYRGLITAAVAQSSARSQGRSGPISLRSRLRAGCAQRLSGLEGVVTAAQSCR